MEKDWEKLKTEYVTTGDSYRALAEKHGVSVHALFKAGSSGKWAEARRQYNEKQGHTGAQGHVGKKNADMRPGTQASQPRIPAADERAADAANLKKLTALQEAADNLAESINRILGDTERFKRYIVGENPDGEEASLQKGFTKLDTRAIRDLTGTLKDLTLIMRNLHNLPTTQERSAMDIALERLRLYRQKAEAQEVGDSETGVVVLAEVLDEEDDGHEETE